jgi:hypothetical protein
MGKKYPYGKIWEKYLNFHDKNLLQIYSLNFQKSLKKNMK